MNALLLVAAVMAHSSALDKSLDRVPMRKAEWEALVQSVPRQQRAAVEYLLTYMPIDDLSKLPAQNVRSAVELAYEARGKMAWARSIPQPIFFDAVLPYASVTEPRQSMRAEFQKRYLSLVAKTKSPGEAALLINQTLFRDYKVTYNTRRLRTDQSPPETIAQGMATCTGLSIMLVDALRSVSVPSRLAGIPSWPGRGGNHTWVEVWDSGKWHFVGAAEPDPKGLDHAWFADEAGHAIANQPDNAIYAVTYRDAGARFPLVWAPDTPAFAENVTARYHHETAAIGPRLMVDVKQGDQRVVADVVALNAATGDELLRGRSLGPHSDVNLHLSSPAAKGDEYLVAARLGDQCAIAWAKVDGDTVVHLELDKTDSAKLAGLLTERFGPDQAKSAVASKLLADVPCDENTMTAAWSAFRSTPDAKLRAEFDAKTVSTPDRTSPYLWRTVGDKPKNGWGLVIAMHGGGNAPKELNDREWQGMFTGYYHDHPEAGGYVYLSLRAPNDTWNGFYDDAICPLIERLILQFVKYSEIDPTQVYICGASHGGYGAYVIGPKIPYRFAAVHPAASSATDGETEGVNLRNVRFTWAVGENDTAFGRIERCRAFDKLWSAWRTEYGGFDGGLEVVTGAGHNIHSHEADKVAEMRKYIRQATPKRIVWIQSDAVLHRFYWLEALAPATKGRIDATVEGNTITLKTEGQGDVALWLSSALVDLKKTVVIVRDGKRQEFKPHTSLGTYCEGLAQTGDPYLSAPVRLVVHGS